jgi:mono/diheme cytochrome c family protein
MVNRSSMACRTTAWLKSYAVACLVLMSGCVPEADFNFNMVYAIKQQRDLKMEFSDQRQREMGDVLTALFGTPDDPHVPAIGVADVDQFVSLAKLERAAGPVGRDERGSPRGLYREHCAHCHGVSGDGAGPTASFLNPYPRDYRMGVFKFKSTPKGFKPTHEDLKRILNEGIAGTAMPSFKVLPENEVEALIHYVRYLSIRGEAERVLLNFTASELEEEDRLLDVQASDELKAEQAAILRDELVGPIIEKWIASEAMATAVPAPDPDRNRELTAARGRELFYGEVANCVKCHGGAQLGDGETTDYDDWTKELEPANTAALAEYLHAGALQPRNIIPRNLRLGVYRGGRRPIDIYWRLRNGIDGSPMPAALIKPDGSPPEVKGLTQADVWCLIDYVRQLQYERISHPAMPDPTNQRERM